MVITMLARSSPRSFRQITYLNTCIYRLGQYADTKQLSVGRTNFCKTCFYRYISTSCCHMTRSDLAVCGSHTSRVQTLPSFRLARSICTTPVNQTKHGLPTSLGGHSLLERQVLTKGCTATGSLITRACHAATVGYTARGCHTVPDSHTTPVFLRAELFQDKLAVVTQHGRYTYHDLLHYSCTLAHEFNEIAHRMRYSSGDSEFPLKGERIAFLCDNDLSYIVTQWAVWMCGAIAVPLCKSHPISELEYFADDSGAKILVCSKNYQDQLEPVSRKLGILLKIITMDDYSGDYDEDCKHWETDLGRKLRQNLGALLEDDTYKDRKAKIVYTSGTTGRPKGVVHTFGNLDAQMQGMISSWGWQPDDVILHVLPLHHVHGIVNVLMTPLYCGATLVMLPNFDAKKVWKALLRTDPPINVFMAVPTIYAKLIEEYDSQKQSEDPYIPDDLSSILTKKFRLMVSGSAALPQPIMEKWEAITGHTLLERYGMTEVGMALTNPLIGDRLPGMVGLPFPGVSVQIVEHSEKGQKVLAEGDSENIQTTLGEKGSSGELFVKGDNVFSEYWNKPDATSEAFTADGWFKTGDTALYSDGVIKIVGRTSVDVIKSGAYKISALDIERHLLEHSGIKDVAIIGLPDEKWGQIITAVVVMRPGETLTLPDLQAWCKDKMAPYQIPRCLKCLDDMPRNAMGKVNKKELAKSLFPEHFS